MFWTILNIIVWIIAIASLIAAISPITETKKDDAFVKKVLGKVQWLINICALNVGKAKDKVKKK
jgi:hypothetical protein